jgi:hypothetical protein
MTKKKTGFFDALGTAYDISQPNIVEVIQSSRMRWVDHVVRMDDKELPKKILLDKLRRVTKTWPSEIKVD